ncbi:MAG: hypothetical protein IPK50_15770 [Fibrobacterota bacterium]|nr:MAG: hypothetical protein IPK50_15770 [Fibrobacterota bacterium]
MKHRPYRGISKAFFVIPSLWGLFSCSDDRVAGKPVVDETTNGFQARIHLADGTPASFAKVRLTPGWYVSGATDSANRTLMADAEGEIEVKGLEQGSWWLEASQGIGGARALLSWNPRSPRPSDLVLAPSGRLIGQTLPLATVRVYGSDRSVKADSLGHYVVDSIAPGPVSLRVDAGTASSDSLIGETTERIVSGQTTTAVIRDRVSTDRALWKEGRLAIIAADVSSRSDSLADFLIPVVLGEAEFSNGLAKPEELLVTDRQGRTLEFHAETWNPSAKTAVVWVRPGRVHPRRGDTLSLLWGKTGFVSNLASTPIDSVYGIWHLGGASIGSNTIPAGPAIARDSGTEAATGIVGEGRQFHGTDWMRIPAPTASSVARGFSVSCWIRADGRQLNHAKILDLGASSAPFGTILLDFDTTTGKAGMQVALGDSSWQRIEAKLPVAGWTHLAATWDGTSREAVFYQDGMEQGRIRTDAPLLDPAGHDLLLGNQSDGLDGIRGILDEVRWDSVARSPDWIRHLHFLQSPSRIVLTRDSH